MDTPHRVLDIKTRLVTRQFFFLNHCLPCRFGHSLPPALRLPSTSHPLAYL